MANLDPAQVSSVEQCFHTHVGKVLIWSGANHDFFYEIETIIPLEVYL